MARNDGAGIVTAQRPDTMTQSCCSGGLQAATVSYPAYGGTLYPRRPDAEPAKSYPTYGGTLYPDAPTPSRQIFPGEMGEL